MTKETKTTKPAQQFRLRGITVSVFANELQDRKTPYYKITTQKTYKDGDDFKTTTSFSREDLPVVELLLKRAWVWVLSQEAADRKEAYQDE